MASTEPPAQAALACQLCRKRKIKCGRELPRCAICVGSQQDCQYPPGPLKPGPKIGASQRGRKRQKPSPSEDSTSQTSRNHDTGSGDAEWESRSINVQATGATSGSLATSLGDFAAGQNHRHGCDTSNPCNESVHSSGVGRRPSQVGADPSRPLSPPATDPSASPRDQLNMQSLSFIVHPSHESCSPEQSKSSEFGTPSRTEPVTLIIARTWVALGVKPQVIYRLVDLYFENFTAFSLFQQPTFEVKAQNVPCSLHLHALLAAMFSFAAPFLGVESYSPGGALDPDNPVIPNAEHFAALAEQFVQEALNKLEDETPPLCLLQALILTTYRKLIKGARGRAWRSLGTCVRLAYEMNLHLVDSEGVQKVQGQEQWVADEERRRAWWAIWEMDIFAGTVRRCPAAIDWSQNETYLPVDDEAFFNGTPRRSCYLERNVVDRWKALNESGNESPKAWFLVVNSLMREAQMLASPRGVPISGSSTERGSDRPLSGRSGWRIRPGKASKDVTERLGAISNALRCFSITLPKHLKYKDQYLSFESTGPDDPKSPRRLHSAIYSIHLMVALAKLMIQHYYVFSLPPDTIPTTEHNDATSGAKEKSLLGQYNPYSPSGLALTQYFEAADDILRIINRCHDDHVRYVNPFLASTVWLAAAAQLLCKVFGAPNTDTSLARSKFEVLYLLHKEFVSYWDISTALQENLNMLEARLERLSARRNGTEDKTLDDGGPKRDSTRTSNPPNIINGLPAQTTFEPPPAPAHASPNVYHIPRNEIPPFSMLASIQTSPGAENPHDHSMHDAFNANMGDISFGAGHHTQMAGSMDDASTFGTQDIMGDLDFSMSIDMSESELQGYLGGVLSGALIG